MLWIVMFCTVMFWFTTLLPWFVVDC